MYGVLKSGYHKSPWGYDNADWSVNDVIKLETKRVVYFKSSMTENDEEELKNNSICRFFEKKIQSDKIRDHCHCHLTGKYRGEAHNKGNFNVTQNESNIIPFIFHNFSNYDCHLFFKR